MSSTAPSFDTLPELRAYVCQAICEYQQLEPDAYDMTETVLLRSGHPCGRYFCLHGPRATKYSAIWDSEAQRVLFYDSTGERYLTVDLETADRLELAIA